MPPNSTFIPRIKVPHQFSNIVLNRPKTGSIVTSKCLPASMCKTFTNCIQDYMDYDANLFDNKNKSLPPICE